MTLPYPEEVEGGGFGQPPPKRATLDIPSHVDALVRPARGGFFIAGHMLSVPGGASREALDRYRRAIAERVVERRPNATEATWMHLERVLGGELGERPTADDDTLRIIVSTIDGL
jgi:hypothetical protein